MNLITVTLPKDFADDDELVVIPKRQFEALVARADEAVSEDHAIGWSREAKGLHAAGKLPKLA